MHINNYKICHTLFLHGSFKLYVMCFHPFKCASAILEILINIFFELFMNQLQLLLLLCMIKNIPCWASPKQNIPTSKIKVLPIQILLPSNFASNRFLFNLLRLVIFPLETLSRLQIRNYYLELRKLSIWNTHTSVWIWASRFCSCEYIPSAMDIRISDDFLVVSDLILLWSFCSSKANSLIALKHWKETISTKYRLQNQESILHFKWEVLWFWIAGRTSTLHHLGLALKVLGSNYFLQFLDVFTEMKKKLNEKKQIIKDNFW